MRVIYFSRDYTPHDHRFLEALASTGHEIFYLRLEDSGRRLESRPIPEGVKAIDWVGGRRPARLTDGMGLLLDLRRVVRQVRPDLIHAGPVQSCAFLTALGWFRPLVTMSWGSDLLLGARSGLGRLLAWLTLAGTDVFICDCEVVRRAAVDLGMRYERIVVFPWGVDLTHFSPGGDGGLRDRLGWRSCFVLISARSWEPIYGVDALVEGFVLAAQHVPSLRLLMLGDGSLRSRIERILDEARLKDRVHFAGQVDQERLPDYYRAADLYVSASRSDGSSVSLLEAMACGLPAVVSNIPGNREWVEPGVNGDWFGVGEPGSLAGILRTMSSDPARLRTMRSEARRTAEVRADWRRNFQELLRAYALAVTLNGGRSG
jgi:glycosyltransferase involved in cell wall biosynthesis